jgi:hypothetical protein
MRGISRIRSLHRQRYLRSSRAPADSARCSGFMTEQHNSKHMKIGTGGDGHTYSRFHDAIDMALLKPTPTYIPRWSRLCFSKMSTGSKTNEQNHEECHRRAILLRYPSTAQSAFDRLPPSASFCPKTPRPSALRISPQSLDSKPRTIYFRTISSKAEIRHPILFAIRSLSTSTSAI